MRDALLELPISAPQRLIERVPVALLVIILAFVSASYSSTPDAPDVAAHDVAPMDAAESALGGPLVPTSVDIEAGSGAGCTASACHVLIEPIRERHTGMMKTIFRRGAKVGEPDGCTVCHGGDPTAATAAEAHLGADPALTELGGPDAFLADPTRRG